MSKHPTEISATGIVTVSFDLLIVPHNLSIYALFGNGPKTVSNFRTALCLFRRAKPFGTTASHPQTYGPVGMNSSASITGMHHYVVGHRMGCNIFVQPLTCGSNKQKYVPQVAPHSMSSSYTIHHWTQPLIDYPDRPPTCTKVHSHRQCSNTNCKN